MINANKKRIKQTIEDIAKFSEIDEGVQRLSYSKEYKQAQDYLIGKMSLLNMETRLDGVGNLYGHIDGEKSKKVIITGSHLDSVRQAGAFDGVAGIVAALEVAHLLQENNIKLNHSYEVIATIGEEGTRFNQTLLGSQFIVGIHNDDKLDSFIGYDDKSLRQTIMEYGLSCDIENTRINENNVKCFLELHGEQGPVLEKENKTIGIVDAIAGINWFEITIIGQSNHAGTVPMNMRHDAAIESYRLIVDIDNYVKENYIGKATVTFGRINVLPNSPNCIPGEVKFTIDIRSSEKNIIEDITNKIIELTSNINKEFKVIINELNKKDPTLLDNEIRKIIEKNCNELNLSYQHINSGAGHDSMIFARKYKTAMIFVPNKDGISHNPKEYINYDDLAKGTDLLFKTIIDIDKGE